MKTHTLLLLILWVVIMIIALVGLFYLTFFTGTVYYAQVDNTNVSEITPRAGMYYRYELPGYDEKGRARLLSFETSRILREGAYLCIEVAPIRGVTKWEEVQPEDMPDKARKELAVAE